MWENLIVSISCLSAIILSVVGIVKLPFGKFKENHPKWYKATFYLLSLILVVVGSIIAELYIIEQPLLSWNFIALILGTCAGVFGGYAGYENTGLKTLLNKLFSSLKTWLSSYSDSKVAKMIEKVGMDKIEAIASTISVKVEDKEENATEEIEEIVIDSNGENSVEKTEETPLETNVNEEKKEGE